MRKLNHLQLEEIKLPAGQEWMDATATWRFVRVHSGAAYWLGGKQARPLAEGEAIIIAPRAEGLVRASQIGDVTLQGFNFTAEMLCGFFTLAERHFFEQRAAAAGEVQFLPSTHPVAQQFAASVARPAREEDLPRRVDALGIVAAVFEAEMARHQPPAVPLTDALERFKKIIAQMPETELINHSSEELARLCGCSPRHFNRLFQQHFGVSARARQTELRLLKSRQLLTGSDEKIVHVALESGYRNLSLFNTLFKKRFGMTPSQWRKSSAKKTGPTYRRRLAAVALAAWCGAATLFAAATNAPLTFRVDAYQVEGAKVLPPEIYAPLFEQFTGAAVTFETIRQARAALLMAYRERGFVTVAVELPPQKLTNGVVQLKVTEGVLADVVVKNNKYFSVENVLRALPSARTNTLLNGLVFQQQLDRANANSDRQIYPVIAPGPEPGTSVLELRVKDRLPFHLHMELNNYATPGTPDLRLNLSGTYNNLWQRDHQVGFQYSLTPEALKDGSEEAPYTQPYERPLIASYSAYYRMPLAPVNGYPRAYALSDFGYDEVTHRFRPPATTGAPELLFYASRSHSDTSQQLQQLTIDPAVIPPTGAFPLIIDSLFARQWTINEDIGVRYSQPLPDFGKISSTLSFGFDYKNYRLRTRQLRSFQAVLVIPTTGSVGPPFTVIPSPSIDSTNLVSQNLQYLPLALGWSGTIADQHGVTAFELNQSVNFIGNQNDFQAAAGSTAADGHYYIASASLTRDQKVWGDWGVRLHADGQWASQPLISNEQFGLGGNAGVRGYLDGRQYGDCGWRVQFEPHTPYINLGLVDNAVPMLARLYAFADYGQTFALNPAVLHRTVSLFGAGCGLDANIGEHFDFRLLLGVPLISPPDAGADNVHVSFSLGMQL